MLALLVPAPFHRPGWVFEEKYDGIRILAYKEGAKVTLLSRNDLDRTARFTDIVAAVGQLRDRTLILDGEVVAFDPKGVSRFQLLQRGDISHRFAIFDCVYRNGRDLRSEPLSRRREELEAALREPPKQLLLSRRLAQNGLTAYRNTRRRGLEGMVAKDSEAPYEERRSSKWLKVKVHQEEEFVIGGFTAPAGARKHLGALLLGAYRGKDFTFVGKVGTGFSSRRSPHSRNRSAHSFVAARLSSSHLVRRTSPGLSRGWSRRLHFRNGPRTKSCASQSFWVCATTKSQANR